MQRLALDPNQPLIGEAPEDSAHRLGCKAQIASNVATGHGEHEPSGTESADSETAGQGDQESRHALVGGEVPGQQAGLADILAEQVEQATLKTRQPRGKRG